MSTSRNIASWLVLGPIYNEAHQTASHHPGDGHPTAADIIMDIDSNALNPKGLTSSLEKAPTDGTSVAYGTGGIYSSRVYVWRLLNFSNIDWGNIQDVEDNIHRHLGAGAVPTDPRDAQSFSGKHHAFCSISSRPTQGRPLSSSTAMIRSESGSTGRRSTHSAMPVTETLGRIRKKHPPR
jgi:hypothetical protein